MIIQMNPQSRCVETISRNWQIQIAFRQLAVRIAVAPISKPSIAVIFFQRHLDSDLTLIGSPGNGLEKPLLAVVESWVSDKNVSAGSCKESKAHHGKVQLGR